jgi:hypothetical protein
MIADACVEVNVELFSDSDYNLDDSGNESVVGSDNSISENVLVISKDFGLCVEQEDIMI